MTAIINASDSAVDDFNSFSAGIAINGSAFVDSSVNSTGHNVTTDIAEYFQLLDGDHDNNFKSKVYLEYKDSDDIKNGVSRDSNGKAIGYLDSWGSGFNLLLDLNTNTGYDATDATDAEVVGPEAAAMTTAIDFGDSHMGIISFGARGVTNADNDTTFTSWTIK